mgnify:CR=1 FL=1
MPNINYGLYAFSKRSYLDLERKYLSVKFGQTTKQKISERIKEQEKKSDNKEKVHTLLTFTLGYHENIELDNKVRWDVIKNTVSTENGYALFEQGKVEYDTKNENDKEFLDVNVEEYLTKYGDDFESIVNDKDFLKTLEKYIQFSIKRVTGTGSVLKNPPELRIHQDESRKKMLKNKDNFWMLLQLSARFGKTYTVLEYTQEISEIYKDDDVALLIISKNLGSNNSFKNDAEGIGYNYEIHTVSLFQDEDNIKEQLKRLKYLKGKRIVIVTDEVDQASHTPESRNKINKTLKLLKGDVMNFILMSGTGIDKGMKIIKDSDYSELEVYLEVVTYNDLLSMYSSDPLSPIVKRRFHYFQFDLGVDLLNISQTIKDVEKHDDLIKYLDLGPLKFNSQYGSRYPYEATKAIQVFVSNVTNSDLRLFADSYQDAHPENDVMAICSENNFTNGSAEDKVLRRLRTNGGKNTVIFCCEMSQRSFSVAPIGRVVILKDGPISDASIQKMSRALTYEKGKTMADIVVISASSFNEFTCGLFQLEEGRYTDSKEREGRFQMFYDNNIFIEHIKGGHRKQNILGMLDDYAKFQTQPNFLMQKYVDDENIDLNGIFGFKHKKVASNTCVVKDNALIKSISDEYKENDIKLDTEKIKKLETLCKFLNILPTVSFEIYGTNDIEDIDPSQWRQMFSKFMDRDVFFKNLKYETFKKDLDNGFKVLTKLSDEEKSDKLIELTSLRQQF